MLAPTLRAKSTSSVSNGSTSITMPFCVAIAAISACTSSTRSSSVNSGPLPVLMATPTTSLSSSRAARAITSRWPLVTGSKVPGYSPTRVFFSGSAKPIRSVCPCSAILTFVLRGGVRSAIFFGFVLDHREDAGHVFAGDDAEQRHAHRLPPGDAHLVGRHPDQPSGVGHQHHVIAGTHREGRNHRGAITRRQGDVGNPLPAAAGDAVLVGRRPLAEAQVGDGEQ